MGSSVLYFSYKKGELKFLIWCLIVYTVTFSLEVLGTSTGIIFGSYTYGNTLGLKFLGVPLIIGFNWVFVILGSINKIVVLLQADSYRQNYYKSN